MVRLSYPLFLWKNHYRFAVFSAIVIAALQFFIIWLITTLDYAPIFAAFLQQLPPRVQVLFDSQFFTAFSVKGALAFGLIHPLVLILMAINAINIPGRHITGEIETGTLELLLAYPVKRTRLILTLWLSACVNLFLIVVVALVGSFSAVVIFHKFTPDLLLRMVQIITNLWLLFVLVMSYTLVIATFGKEGSKTGACSGGLLLVIYFIYYLSTLWPAIAFTKPANIFTYYQPQKIILGHWSFGMNVQILGLLIVICLILSIIQFNRRDIPG